ncbi:MAG: DUF951 domain-containing protein [Chloroflexi bacterium]|nr:DUF951 domain-containing protein [Chloroflexota bacterium]MCH8196203.1 DUF951 domain-containing protein [Chloroflexota bacterium]MCH8283304.1 DUF951 domain-containing protein [Chloroflexota bacterium]MCI0769471.1 DUF951 domain-containing protein [Chloroflexota bacterium]
MGQVLTLKKGHPCGANRWEVVRLGADIGIKCLGCGRRVLMQRSDLARRVKSVDIDAGAG